MELLFLKSQTGLVPACEESSDWLKRKKMGATILVDPREPRNGIHFRRWWALVKTGYDYWADSSKTLEYKGKPVLPDFDRFRKDVTIMAGFYYPVANIKGEVRIEAESLKWASMSEQRFNQLYDATVNVLLRQVFNGEICAKWTDQELRNVVEEIMRFAA